MATPKTPRSSAYLLKSKQGKGWLKLGVTGWEWTQDKNAALQFVREIDARTVGAKFMAGNYDVTEYQL